MVNTERIFCFPYWGKNPWVSKKARGLNSSHAFFTSGSLHLLGAKSSGDGALKVVSSSVGRDLFIQDVVNGDGMIQGQASFELEVLI